MTLSKRQQQILAAIVRMYIISGEPVGSKLLCEVMENAPSSATLRNEMSTLCNLGFLDQPHTSAGRIPTAAGYKLYVETLMDKDLLSDELRGYIDSSLTKVAGDPDALPDTAGKVLSQITGLPSIAADISPAGPKVKRVELLKLSDRLAMIILITSDGHSRSRLCHTADVLSYDVTHQFDKLVNEFVKGKNISQLNPAALQTALSSLGIQALSVMPLFSTLSVMISDMENSAVSISGQSALYNISFLSGYAEKIIALMHKRDTLLSLLGKSSADAGVVFGGETSYSALRPTGIVFAKYRAGNNNEGCLGVIGPTRMSYEQILPSIEYTAKRMNELLTETLSGMEE